MAKTTEKRTGRRVLHAVLGTVAALIAAAFVFVLVQQPPEKTYLPEAKARALAQEALARYGSQSTSPLWGANAVLDGCFPFYDLREQVCQYTYFVAENGTRVGSIDVMTDAENPYAVGEPTPDLSPYDVFAQQALGRRIKPQEHLYRIDMSPYPVALRNGDGTYTVIPGENMAAQQIPAWNFWLACKAQLAMGRVMAWMG